MNKYKWHGINDNGSPITGINESENPAALQSNLLKNNIALLGWVLIKTTNNPHSSWLSFFHQDSTISEKLLFEFFDHLGLLLDQGIQLTQALDVIGSTTSNIILVVAIQQISTKVKQGESFHAALRCTTSSFTEPMINSIQAGEKTGHLNAAITAIKGYIFYKSLIKSLITKACIGPLITCSIAFFIFLGVIIFIVPRFEQLYILLGNGKHNDTTYLFTLYHYILSTKCLIHCLLLFALFFCIKKQCKKVLVFIITHTPYLNRFLQYHDLIILNETLIMFLKTGLPLHTALSQAKESVRLSTSNKAIQKIHDFIISGKTLRQAFELTKSPIFTKEYIAFIIVGDVSGKLISVLEKLTTMQHTSLKKHVDTITNIIIPLLMLTTGLTIGMLMITLYKPLFNIGTLFNSFS